MQSIFKFLLLAPDVKPAKNMILSPGSLEIYTKEPSTILYKVPLDDLYQPRVLVPKRKKSLTAFQTILNLVMGGTFAYVRTEHACTFISEHLIQNYIHKRHSNIV